MFARGRGLYLDDASRPPDVSWVAPIGKFFRTGYQPACKPGSVGPGGSARILRTWRPFLWDGRCRPSRATNPGDGPEEGRARSLARAAPIRFCSRWGLPCRPRCRVRGALLPHPFTLAGTGPQGHARWSALCGTVPGVAPAGRYPAPSLHGARTFLPGSRAAGEPADGTGAAARPADRADVRCGRVRVKAGVDCRARDPAKDPACRAADTPYLPDLKAASTRPDEPRRQP
jgi:hypothetical protein